MTLIVNTVELILIFVRKGSSFKAKFIEILYNQVPIKRVEIVL